MATSSITDNIFVDNSQVMVEYINAMEAALNQTDEKEIHSYVVTDPEILQKIFSEGLQRRLDK